MVLISSVISSCNGGGGGGGGGGGDDCCVPNGSRTLTSGSKSSNNASPPPTYAVATARAHAAALRSGTLTAATAKYSTRRRTSAACSGVNFFAQRVEVSISFTEPSSRVIQVSALSLSRYS